MISNTIEDEVIRKLRERSARGKLNGIDVTYRVTGGAPGEQLVDEEVHLSGRGPVHARLRAVTGASVELTAADGRLRLGRSGTNGAVSLFSADAKSRVEISGAGAAVRGGGNGANGSVALSGAHGQQRIGLSASDAVVRAGGNGVNGTVSVLGRDNESVIGVGRNDRPAPISMFGSQGEMVRLDGTTGDIALMNADCAEEFDVAGEHAEPGAVMVLTDDGSLMPSEKPYDTRVAGVVSGAGSYRPGLLDRRDTGKGAGADRVDWQGVLPVDATDEPVRVGDCSPRRRAPAMPPTTFARGPCSARRCDRSTRTAACFRSS